MSESENKKRRPTSPPVETHPPPKKSRFLTPERDEAAREIVDICHVLWTVVIPAAGGLSYWNDDIGFDQTTVAKISESLFPLRCLASRRVRFTTACEADAIVTAKWIAKHRMHRNEAADIPEAAAAFHWCVVGERIYIAEWLLEEFPGLARYVESGINLQSIRDTALGNGRMTGFRWLDARFPVDWERFAEHLKKDHFAWKAACGGRHLEAAKLIAKECKIDREFFMEQDTLYDLCDGGCRPVACPVAEFLEWLEEWFGLKAEDFLKAAPGNYSPLEMAMMAGRLDAVEWIHSRFNIESSNIGACDDSDDWMVIWKTIRNGHLDVATWLAENVYPTGDDSDDG
jgi:hypothetical protein